jgi:hypothetical protein
MQAHLESTLTDLLNGGSQMSVHRRFTAAEYHAIEQADPALEKIEHGLP